MLPQECQGEGGLQQGQPEEKPFDYTPLAPDAAQQVRLAAGRIRDMVKQTLKNIIKIGNELLAVKKTLPYGHLGRWVRAEFGWSERTAYNFVAVAQSFGGTFATIAKLPIEPTAAYLLAASSVPEEARLVAIERAKNGEEITVSVARKILAAVGRQPARQGSRQRCLVSDEKLWGKLLEAFEPLRQLLSPGQMPALAHQMRKLADSLEKG